MMSQYIAFSEQVYKFTNETTESENTFTFQWSSYAISGLSDWFDRSTTDQKLIGDQ